MKTLTIRKNIKYSTSDVFAVAHNQLKVAISPEIAKLVKLNFDAVSNMSSSDSAYGMNTGVADLCSEHPNGSSDEVQKKLLLSHSVGTGDNLPKEIVRAAIFSRLLVFTKGVSGVSVELLTFMSDILNNDIIPYTPSLGSVGLSDLTIMAGIFVILCDKGKVSYKGKAYSPYSAFKKAKIDYPRKLKTREGLALLNNNGCAVGACSLILEQLFEYIDATIKVAALSYEGKTGVSSSFSSAYQYLKPFTGRITASRKLEAALEGSTMVTDNYLNKEALLLQDPISFKTITQVIGGAIDVFENTTAIVETELNGVTDNPIMINNGSAITRVSSGSYYCAQLATALDELSLVTARVASASVARIKILLNDKYNEGLPKYLISDSTNNSGFMIFAYVAQSVLSEIQVRLYPHSSISSSVANGWEDISSNATNTAMNTKKILELSKEILAIEYSLAIQSMALRKANNPKVKFGNTTSDIYKKCTLLLNKSNVSLPVFSDSVVREFRDEMISSEMMSFIY